MDGSEKHFLVNLQLPKANHFEDSEKGHDDVAAIRSVIEEVDESAWPVGIEARLEPPDHFFHRDGLALENEIGPLSNTSEHFAERAQKLEQVDIEQSLLRRSVLTVAGGQTINNGLGPNESSVSDLFVLM